MLKFHDDPTVVDAMHLVDEANVSKMDILRKVEEASEEVKTRKKALEEALERVEAVRIKVSLGQMLGKQNADPSFDKQAEKENGQKLFSAKRKKFGFGRFSLLLTKQQKKKKPTLNLRCIMACFCADKTMRLYCIFLSVLISATKFLVCCLIYLVCILTKVCSSIVTCHATCRGDLCEFDTCKLML